MSENKFFQKTDDGFECIPAFKDEMLTAKLPPGQYRFSPGGMMAPPMFIRATGKTDKLIEFESGVARNIINETEHFLSQEVKEAFARYEFVHRRGFLIYGKQGGGKSCLFQQIARDFEKRGGIVLWGLQPGHIRNAVHLIRRGDDKQYVLVILEEFESFMGSHETTLLQMMDGNDTIPNIIWLASTNYIDRISARFKNRPTRFATVQELSGPDERQRRQYIEANLKPEDQKKFNVGELVKKTNGLVVDQIKDIIISVVCLGLSVDKAVEKIRSMDKA